MADADHLQRAAHACVQASLNVDDDATAAFLLESARRLLDRANPELDVTAFNRQQIYEGLQ